MRHRIKTAPLSARQRADAETLREEREQERQRAQMRSAMPKPQKSPSGIIRRRLDHDALDAALREAHRTVNGVLDVLRVADEREGQMSKADEDARANIAGRFEQMGKPGLSKEIQR
jgi:hypothetical protein